MTTARNPELDSEDDGVIFTWAASRVLRLMKHRCVGVISDMDPRKTVLIRDVA